MHRMGRLLGTHVLFQSRDLDASRERVARVFCPHRLGARGSVSMASTTICPVTDFR